MALINLRHAEERAVDKDVNEFRQRMIYRQIGWVNAMRMVLRQHEGLED